MRDIKLRKVAEGKRLNPYSNGIYSMSNDTGTHVTSFNPF